ncbi:MAG: hypothetical protein WB646_03195 [Steroidobacteraceae bacterium]
MVRKPSLRKRRPVNLEDLPIPNPVHISDRVRLHVESTNEVLALIVRCHALRDSGKIGQARKLFRRVEKLNDRLLELEDTGRWTPRMH